MNLWFLTLHCDHYSTLLTSITITLSDLAGEAWKLPLCPLLTPFIPGGLLSCLSQIHLFFDVSPQALGLLRRMKCKSKGVCSALLTDALSPSSSEEMPTFV